MTETTNLKFFSTQDPPACIFAGAQPLVNKMHAEGRTITAQRDRLLDVLRMLTKKGWTMETRCEIAKAIAECEGAK